MPRRHASSRRSAPRRAVRAAFPWHDSDDIPEPLESDTPDFPWDPWLTATSISRRRG